MVDYNNPKYNPDIEMGTIFKVSNYICEVDDFNFDNKDESIVFIYENKKDYENGEYLEQISLNNRNIKTNIREYMQDNYDIKTPKISKCKEDR